MKHDNNKQNPTVTKASDGTVSLTVPIKLIRRNGRKRISSAIGSAHRPLAPTPLQAALIRGFHWKKILTEDENASMKSIAVKENIDNSYVSRMINLTTLAPDIIEAILDDEIPSELTLFDLAVEPPRLWGEQRDKYGINSKIQVKPYRIST